MFLMSGGSLPQPTRSPRPLDMLLGRWEMVGSHPAFTSEARGTSSFEWLTEGALLKWHFNWDKPGPPTAVSVIGGDDSDDAYSVLYADERGVRRVYRMTLDGGLWRMSRDSEGFSQRMTGTFNADGTRIDVRWELSRDGSTWTPDLNVIYSRVR